MKKFLIPLLLFVACIFTFAACDNQENKNDYLDGNLCGGPPLYESTIDEFIENFDRHSPFVDNQVLIILTEEVSFKNIFHDYTAEDFLQIGAIDVHELDGSTTESTGLTYRIRQCLLEDPSGNTIPEHLKHYTRTFCITLDKKDEDNVLRAVYLLKQRTDIYLAEPNWIESPDV